MGTLFNSGTWKRKDQTGEFDVDRQESNVFAAAIAPLMTKLQRYCAVLIFVFYF